MRTPADGRLRALITALLTKKKPPRRDDKQSFRINLLLLCVVAFVGFYAGFFAGSSRTSTATTVVPLLFGLLTAFLLTDVSYIRIVAITMFVFSFMIAYDFGEHVDEPMTVQQMLDAENIHVSDAIFNELTLLDTQLRALDLDGSRHNAILFGVGAQIIESDTLAVNQQLEQLHQFRIQLHEIGR